MKTICRAQTERHVIPATYALTAQGPKLIIECQREAGHSGDHAAYLMSGYIEWRDAVRQ